MARKKNEAVSTDKTVAKRTANTKTAITKPAARKPTPKKPTPKESTPKKATPKKVVISDAATTECTDNAPAKTTTQGEPETPVKAKRSYKKRTPTNLQIAAGVAIPIETPISAEGLGLPQEHVIATQHIHDEDRKPVLDPRIDDELMKSYELANKMALRQVKKEQDKSPAPMPRPNVAPMAVMMPQHVPSPEMKRNIVPVKAAPVHEKKNPPKLSLDTFPTFRSLEHVLPNTTFAQFHMETGPGGRQTMWKLASPNGCWYQVTNGDNRFKNYLDLRGNLVAPPPLVEGGVPLTKDVMTGYDVQEKASSLIGRGEKQEALLGYEEGLALIDQYYM